MRGKAALTVGFKRTGSEAIHVGKKGLMVPCHSSNADKHTRRRRQSKLSPQTHFEV